MLGWRSSGLRPTPSLGAGEAWRARLYAPERMTVSVSGAVSEDELKQLEAEEARAKSAAELRKEDYQLAYAIDILSGLSVLSASK